MMCDVERLVSYLYDELPEAERAAVEEHLAACAACRLEVQGFRQTRVHLASWAPPEPDFGFRIVRGGADTPVATRTRSLPRWAAAAAAALVLAASAAVANLEVRYGQDGLVVRTGWADRTAPAATAEPGPAAVPVSASSDQWRAEVRALAERLRQLEGAAAAPSTRRASATRPSDAELLSTFRRILAESEVRQEEQLKLRVAQVWKDMEAVRANDLARFDQNLRQVQGLTDAELIRHRETLNYLYANVSQRQQR